jgi:hypothetical protein
MILATCSSEDESSPDYIHDVGTQITSSHVDLAVPMWDSVGLPSQEINVGCPNKNALLFEERASPLALEIHNDFSILKRYPQYVIDRWHFLRPPRSGFIDMRSLLDLLYLAF